MMGVLSQRGREVNPDLIGRLPIAATLSFNAQTFFIPHRIETNVNNYQEVVATAFDEDDDEFEVTMRFDGENLLIEGVQEIINENAWGRDTLVKVYHHHEPHANQPQHRDWLFFVRAGRNDPFCSRCGRNNRPRYVHYNKNEAPLCNISSLRCH